MPTTETFTGLTGNGDEAFAGSGEIYLVRVDVTALGSANAVDPDATFKRYFKIGWWVFVDGSFALGQAGTCDIHFIEFQASRFDFDVGIATQVGGYHGFHYHLYSGVTATFNFAET